MIANIIKSMKVTTDFLQNTVGEKKTYNQKKTSHLHVDIYVYFDKYRKKYYFWQNIFKKIFQHYNEILVSLRIVHFFFYTIKILFFLCHQHI